MHKHHNKQCSRRRTPTVLSGTEQLKLARRRRHAEDVTSATVIQCRERATPASRSKSTRKSDRRFRFRRTQIGNARVRYSSAGVSMSQTVQDSRPEARGVRFGRNKKAVAHLRSTGGTLEALAAGSRRCLQTRSQLVQALYVFCAPSRSSGIRSFAVEPTGIAVLPTLDERIDSTNG